MYYFFFCVSYNFFFTFAEILIEWNSRKKNKIEMKRRNEIMAIPPDIGYSSDLLNPYS